MLEDTEEFPQCRLSLDTGDGFGKGGNHVRFGGRFTCGGHGVLVGDDESCVSLGNANLLRRKLVVRRVRISLNAVFLSSTETY